MKMIEIKYVNGEFHMIRFLPNVICEKQENYFIKWLANK